MSDGQSEACLFNEPDHLSTGDMPFGEAGERRRRELEKSEQDKPTLVAKIRAEIRRIEERAKQRRKQQ
jgi:hypothetical protein